MINVEQVSKVIPLE